MAKQNRNVNGTEVQMSILKLARRRAELIAELADINEALRKAEMNVGQYNSPRGNYKKHS